MIRILVVEDEPSVASLIQHQLRLDGPDDFDVRLVTGGFEDLLTGGPWEADVVVLDLWLEPAGFEQAYPMARAIAHRRPPGTVLIVMSAVADLHPNPEIERMAYAIMPKHHIDKLSAVIRKAVAAGRPQSPHT